MKAKFSKSLVAVAVAAVSMFASATASADQFNPFVVQKPGTTGTGTTTNPNQFTADKITGNYSEVITFDGRNFEVSLKWEAGQFVTNNGNDQVKKTGLNESYGLYALYTAKGTVSINAAGDTLFNFTPGTGNLAVFLDANADTSFTAPTEGGLAFGLADNGDDVKLADGDALRGQGLLRTTSQNCGTTAGIECGSFGAKSTFELTDFGKTFFIKPDPFYQFSFQSGQLNNFVPTGTVNINGSLDVVFSDVPEPASVGLLGLGLLGLGAARRRKQAK
jgi:hypothetical protein